jgi:divinyl chlorophyllide a 8-vinyl-reductase
VLVAGASGYIGRHVVAELARRSRPVIALLRPGSATAPGGVQFRPPVGEGAITVSLGDVTDPASLERAGFGGRRIAAVVSCIASRSGGIRDSWAVDWAANRNLLAAAQKAGVERFVLLSAICVQKPLLAFQHAKLEFERELIASALRWSIVRPTAYFKSLAGQIPRIRQGKPFLLIGPGDGPACKPISERDVAVFIANCLTDDTLENHILPIGGPDAPLTVRQRAELIFELAGRRPRYRRIPLALVDAVITGLTAGAKLLPSLADKAEFGRIARYYATESMLVLDKAADRYDGDATPSFGTATLRDFYSHVFEHGLADNGPGDHALF